MDKQELRKVLEFEYQSAVAAGYKGTWQQFLDARYGLYKAYHKPKATKGRAGTDARQRNNRNDGMRQGRLYDKNRYI